LNRWLARRFPRRWGYLEILRAELALTMRQCGYPVDRSGYAGGGSQRRRQVSLGRGTGPLPPRHKFCNRFGGSVVYYREAGSTRVRPDGVIWKALF
jgi:hypothetical protein